jgi:hypothetical protein
VDLVVCDKSSWKHPLWILKVIISFWEVVISQDKERGSPCHIIVNAIMLRTLKAAREKHQVTFKGKPV